MNLMSCWNSPIEFSKGKPTQEIGNEWKKFFKMRTQAFFAWKGNHPVVPRLEMSCKRRTNLELDNISLESVIVNLFQ